MGSEGPAHFTVFGSSEVFLKVLLSLPYLDPVRWVLKVLHSFGSSEVFLKVLLSLPYLGPVR